MSRRTGFFVALLAVAVVVMSFQSQSEKKNTLTVTGTGKIKYKPDTAVLTFQVSGGAEEAVSAEKKHADKLKRVQEALAKLDLKDGEINNHAIAISTGVTKGDERQMYYSGGSGASQAMPEISLSTTMKVTIKGIIPDAHADVAKKVASIIDAAVVAGADNKGAVQYSRQYGTYTMIGGGPAVAFTLSDDKAVQIREKALASAVEEAKKKAGKLAGLVNRKLGRAVTVSEGDITPDKFMVVNDPNRSQSVQVARENLMLDSLLSEKELSSTVTVTFELAD